MKPNIAARLAKSAVTTAARREISNIVNFLQWPNHDPWYVGLKNMIKAAKEGMEAIAKPTEYEPVAARIKPYNAG